LNIYPQQATSCGHHGIGQELCSVCHQRAKRNIPVYIQEEKRNREADEEKLLKQYQHDRDVDEQKKRDVKSIKIIFFNLIFLFF
jgi:hypothetical protein